MKSAPALKETDASQLPRAAFRITEVAQMLAVSVPTVYRRIHDGDLRAKRVGGITLVPATALAQFLEGDSAPKAA